MVRRLIAPWGGLPPTVYSLLAVQFVGSTGSFVQPFLALLLTQSLGLDPLTTGLWLSVGMLVFVPGNLWGGRLMDRWGRRRVLLVSRTFGALLLVPCGFLTSSFWLVPLLLASFVASSFGGPGLSAIVADVTPAPRRQNAYSLLYLGHNLGFALGTTAAGLLFAHARAWLFWGEAALLLASVVLTAALVPETRPTESDVAAGKGSEAAHEGSVWSALGARPLVIAFCGLVALLWMGYIQVGFGLPLWLTALHGTTDGPGWYGLFMGYTALVVLVVTPLVTKLAEGRPAAASVGVGALLIGAGLAGFLAAGSIVWLFVAGFVFTVGEVLWATGAPAFVANHSPVTHRGRFQSLLNTLQNLGALAGPGLGGLVASGGQLVLLWPWAAGANLVAAAGLFFIQRKEKL